MAVNKFMHPRNIYKNPPDFKKLAACYPEFSNITQMDVTGKIRIDFKDPHVLRILTRCLLKSDFNLDVFIPEERLVPTLPLRLNYVLWIEDLLNAIKKEDLIHGIDIGTGACAIYPLLAACKNKWYMTGTETDDESLKIAEQNVERNNLQNLIKLTKNSTKSTIEHLFKEQKKQDIYDFCMCNPPFYTSLQEVWESRSPARPPPKNGFTGSPQELITEGGELQFCRKMLDESKKLKNNITIFTTMLGHKFNLKELVLDLKAEHINHTTTEFCQGRVTRWGLAWTYQDYDLLKLVPPRDKTKKKCAPITFVIPKIMDQPYSMEYVTNKIKLLLNKLKISYNIITKRKNELCLDMKAYMNTWSNQRRKRRQLMQSEREEKIPKLEKACKTINEVTVSLNEKITNNTSSTNVESSGNQVSKVSGIDISQVISNDISTQHNQEIINHTLLKLVSKDDLITLSLDFLDGSAGKEGLHQIFQYIKNNWKYIFFLFKTPK